MLIALWLGLEYFILGPFSYVRIGDNLDMFVPRLIASGPILAEQGLTYWYSLTAGGMDRLANDINYFNLSNWLFFFLPGWLAYVLVILGAVFLGGYYTFRLCRDCLFLGRGPSVFAGLAFAAGLVREDILPYLLGLSILPVGIYYLEFLAEARGGRRFAYTILLGTLFSFFSSPPLTLPFTLAAVFIWFIFVRKKYSLDFLGPLITFSVSALVWHLPVFWSVWVNTSASSRAGIYYDVNLLFYVTAVTGLVLKNWLALLVALGGFLLGTRERQWLWLVLWTAVFIFVFQLYRPLATIFGHYFSLFRNFGFDRFYLVVPFFASLAAALVLNQMAGFIKTEREYSLRAVAIFLAIALLFVGNLFLKGSRTSRWLRDGSYTANVLSPAFLALARQQGGAPFRVATIADEKTGLRPGLANIHGLESVDGEPNIVSRRYLEFFTKMAKPKKEIKHSLYFLWQATEEEKRRFLQNSTEFLNPDLLSLANVKYLVSLWPVALPGFTLLPEAALAEYEAWQTMSLGERVWTRIKENFQGRPLLVYENQKVFPRFFLTQKVQVFDNSQELLKALAEADLTTLRRTAFIESTSASALNLSQLGGDTGDIKDIKVDLYSPDEIRLKATADGSSILVITNNYSPFWQAAVAGQKKTIVPVDHAFMGIFLEGGNQKVVLRYEPPYSLRRLSGRR